MSKENVELARRCYDAFQRGDVTTALQPLGPAFVMEDSTRADAMEYRGREGFLKWVGEWADMFDDWQIEVDRVLDAGGQVLALGRDWGRGKGSGVLVEEHFGHLWTFRGEEPTRMVFFNDWGKALEAAGLRE
jgi:ketosteroid isomerase-like protein